MLGGSLTALVMRWFEHSLIDIPQVTYFVPLIAARAGNIGIQSSSIVVRGLATGAIDTGDLVVRVWGTASWGFAGNCVFNRAWVNDLLIDLECWDGSDPVSYTHLTLPTIVRV